MIPHFDENGDLPPGIFLATIDEVDARFGQESEIRKAEIESLRWLLDLARRAGVRRIVVDGSFVTDVLEPNDVDCVLLIEPGFPNDAGLEAELLAGLPFIAFDLVEQAEFDMFAGRIYATDRRGIPKGLVEIVIWP